MSDPTRRGWIAWFARNPVAANLLMAMILISGLMTTLNLRVEAFPPLPPKSVSISVDYDSGSASAAEEGLAIKLEEALQGVQGIKKVSSYSSGNGTTVTIERTSGYDLDILYRDIKNRVDAIATLPARAERPVITQETYLEDAVSLHIYGDADYDALQESARRLRLKLLANPAIERVDTIGRRTPEITISADEASLQAQGLTLADIADRINGASLIEAGGELFGPDGRLVVKADRQRYRQRDFEQIVIKEGTDGRQLLLSDIARIDDGYDSTPVLSRYNGQPAVGLNLKMYSSSDIMKISEAVATEVESFRETLPAGMEIEIWADRSSYIASRLGLLAENSLIGVALVMLLLALFLNLRVAFWVACGLPVAFAGALLLMDPKLFNLTLNELTTFGFIIALGIVVDDAVVVGESIYATRQQRGASLGATIQGAQRVAAPTVFGVLTTMVAFMALALVEGEMGKIFSFFAWAAAFCLFFSLIETKLILPAHLAHVQMESNPGRYNYPARLWSWIQGNADRGLSFFTRKLYRPFIHGVLGQRYSVLLIAVALFILVVGMVPSGKIRTVFFPDVPSDFIVVRLALEEDAGYGLTHQQALKLEQAAMRIDRRLQSSEEQPLVVHQMTLVEDESSATIIAELSPRDSRPVSTDEFAELWRKEVGPLEALRKLKFVTSWEGAEDISIELRSEQPATLTGAGRRVRQALAGYPGLSAIQNSLKAGQPQIDLELRPEGRALGLSTADLARQVQQAYQGYEVQRFQRGKDEVKVKVRYPDRARSGFDDLAGARIRTADGRVLPLSSVAHISSRYVASDIERVNGSRVAIITADVDKTLAAPAEILASLEQELFPELRLQYPDLEIHLSGEASEEAETTASLKTAFVLALIAIYGLLAIPLKSYLQPLLIMSAIPFGIVGALLGHWLHGLPISLLSMFGILALSGVVVNDSLLLVNRYNEQRRAGEPPRLAMVRAACARMRAILLTSITTYAGLMPLIAETSEQAQFLIPAAVAMGYGILFATLITLILVPTLVIISEDLSPAGFRQRRRRRQQNTAGAGSAEKPAAADRTNEAEITPC